MPFHNFQRVCLRRQPSMAALFWKMERPGRNFKSRHDDTFGVSPDLVVETQSHYDNDSSLSFNERLIVS